MLESFKEKIYIAKETVRGYWYTLTHLKVNDDSWEALQEIQRPERDRVQAEINRRCSMSMQRRIAEDLRKKAMREQRHIVTAEQNRWYPGIDRDRAPDDNDFERHHNWMNHHVPSYAASSSSQADHKTDYRVCNKHGNYNVFYDLKKYFECPMCVEEREKIQKMQIVDFITENEMKI